MKKFLCTMLVTICILTVSAGFPPNSEAQSKKVSVQLAWVVGGLHAGFFVAKEKGFYASKGLEVTINRGFGSGDTAKVVATGTAQFGEVNLPTAIISRGKEVPLSIVGVIIGKAPESILSFSEKGIRKPKDVEGKTFAEASGAAIMVTWPAFAKLAGIDINKTTHIPVEAAAKPAVFFSGQVDWVPGFRPGKAPRHVIDRFVYASAENGRNNRTCTSPTRSPVAANAATPCANAAPEAADRRARRTNASV